MNTSGQPLTYAGLRAERHGEPDGRPPFVLLHGLGGDRSQWGPLLRALEVCDPGRSVLAVDLPGHGQSPLLGRQGLDDVAAVVHQAVGEAGLAAPVVVGHSLGGAIATAYAAVYPVLGAVNIDQPLWVAGFAAMLRDNEQLLRGPGYGTLWNRLAGGMGIDELPPDVRGLAGQSTVPAQELLLGYWDELLSTPAPELQERHAERLARIAADGTAYHYVAGAEPDPEYRRWLCAALPEAIVTVLPKGGHFPHLAHPERLARLLA
ncbi:alpha/beta hydrolase [Streptomyces cocklensis]|uniref:Pimeloyl-ACP methyl ester carboxylesterase n=1 Tax=Actinacidiphila cocklensis TaxID=887465 RepID=A0A9W4EAC0_9ACTN|nr:alpha/beta fold hydrolase [Actinacidiphila cocklensis]MDD1059868.1 alpha/beta hydrolase [Actinacidiphila cocklensis]WSX72736.1 alpha/beta hydrolase [Streptomyces sp. NBC_00899]WSX81196.1 alpha/beta hydrolase [Streptomyces sp. NBC_00899]CAG6397168.1 Pimeloyl-ACP methyl ester carboxylesterase [Actinacidiphila cocklensis]